MPSSHPRVPEPLRPTVRPPIAHRIVADRGGAEALLTRIAQLVAAAPAGTGLLVEGPVTGGTWRVIASTVELERAIASLAREFPGALHPERGGRAPGPTRRRASEIFGELVAADRGSYRAAPEAERWRVPVPADLWVGVQSHWFSDGCGRIRRYRRYRLSGAAVARGEARIRLAAALTAADPAGEVARLRWPRSSWWAGRRWRSGARPWGHGAAPSVAPEEAPQGLRVEPLRPFPSPSELAGHLVVFGASGSGKTTFLAGLAARAIRARAATLLLDVHGDLAPAVLGQLAPDERRRVRALEADPDGPGVAILDGAGGAPDQEAAFVVAALKRLSADGPELYWGYRLERIFETFVRIAQAEGGTLLDVYALLTDPRRREASRLATRSPAIAAFLDELPAILRRNPEFLWPAAARVARIALAPALASLLAPPPDSTVPIGATLRRGTSLAVRLPVAQLGPEASAFAATLVLTRAYLELATGAGAGRPVLVVLDEATAFSPRLVAELLTEGRKFGVRAVVATQYPERLAPEVRHAAAGSAGTHVAFRVPLAAAASVGTWIGLAPERAGRALAGLPVGWATVAPIDGRPEPRQIVAPLPPAAVDPGGWRHALAATRAEYPAPPSPLEGRTGVEPVEEGILLALFGSRRPVPAGELFGPAAGIPIEEAAARLERLGPLVRRGWVVEAPDGYVLTAAGARGLGAGAEHGSASEGAEHRRLLLETLQILARQGERLELLRQGRFDTQLPDARLTLVRAPIGPMAPWALARAVDRARGRWAWRYFGGRDVHVEAEVSGAERADRVRRGWEKARRAGAFALFVVPDVRRSRRVTASLRRWGAPRTAWAVWTLPPHRGAGNKSPPPVA